MKIKSTYAKQRIEELTKQYGSRLRRKVKLTPRGRKRVKIGTVRA